MAARKWQLKIRVTLVDRDSIAASGREYANCGSKQAWSISQSVSTSGFRNCRMRNRTAPLYRYFCGSMLAVRFPNCHEARGTQFEMVDSSYALLAGSVI
jgi:hypothetical protein